MTRALVVSLFLLVTVAAGATEPPVWHELPGTDGDSYISYARWHVGKPPYGPMQEAAQRRGFDLSDLRARQFETGDFHRFDLIIGMDDSNIADIEALRPTGSDTPVRLLTDFAPESGIDHVPDPYYTRDFDGALDLIEAAAQGLVRSLAR